MSEENNNTNSTKQDINETPELPPNLYLNINVDQSELIPGYQLFFQSRYQDALKFFESKKDTDIRFLIGYTKTLLAYHQLEYIAPFNLLINAFLQAVNKTFDMIGVVINEDTKFKQYLPQIKKLDYQKRKLFYWAVAHCCQLQFFLYAKNSTMEKMISSLTDLLLFGYVNPDTFDFKSYFPQWEFSNELKALFSIQISEDNSEEDQELQQQQNSADCIFIRRDNEDAVYKSTLEKELTLSNSEEIEKTWLRVCLAALAGKKIDLKFTFGLFEQLQKMLPQFDLGYQFHADALVYHNRFQAAREYYDKAIQLNPQNVVAINNKGYSYEYGGTLNQNNEKLHRAIEFYKAAIEICPTYHIFHNNVSMCYEKLEDNELGIHYCLNSLEINCKYQHGFQLLNDFLSHFTVIKSEKLQSYINRSTVLLKRQDPEYFREVFMKFENQAPLLFQGSLQDSLSTNFIDTAGFVITTLQKYIGKATPILKKLEEQARALLTILVYSKHLKQEFSYQPSCFYWELYLL